MTIPRFISAEEVMAALSWREAVDALDRALAARLDDAETAARSIIDVDRGQLLLMPAASRSHVGVKIATVAPHNAGLGLPRIHAVYVLMDGTTLEPVALIDGTALTTLRTPALSAVATRYLAREQAEHLVVFGSGPQAWGHVQALRAVRPVGTVTIVGRDHSRARTLAESLEADGLNASCGTTESVATADIVVCATTSPTPLFNGDALRNHACVIAVGSHDPSHRELDNAVVARAARDGGVIVETIEVALREAGDIVLPVKAGLIGRNDLTALADVVRRGPASQPSTFSLFKSVGMGWQDLIVAQAILERHNV